MKKRIHSLLALCAPLLVLTTCIEPFGLEATEGANLLTVDGLISTGPGPHAVKLTLSDRFAGIGRGTIKSVQEATLAIRDGAGRVTFLQETYDTTFTQGFFDWRLGSFISRQVITPSGTYFTPEDFSAEVGQTYTLQIILADGREFSSLPEKVPAVPVIETLSLSPKRLATQNPLIDITGMEITVSFQDVGATQDYYLWRPDNGMFALIAEPEEYHHPPTHSTCPRCHAPKDCCKVCFMADTLVNRTFQLASDENFNGLKTTLSPLFIQDNGARFKSRYRFRFNQHAITANAYSYLRLVRQQLDIDGSVFDPLPANIRGNIINLQNPDEQVLGYFFATDAVSRTIYIDRSDLPPEYRQNPIFIPDDCRLTPRALHDPPADWEF